MKTVTLVLEESVAIQLRGILDAALDAASLSTPIDASLELEVDPLLLQPISTLNLPPLVAKKLWNVDTVLDLVCLSETDLIRRKGWGSKCHHDFKEALA